MDKVIVILHKEWLDLKQQRGLLLGILLPPLFLVLLPIGILYGTRLVPGGSLTNANSLNSLIERLPALAGMTQQEVGQAIVGMQFNILFLLLPLMIPSIIAAYSIVGEKTSRTLEPVLATPVRTWELLLGKSLTALIPAIGLTWLVGGIYIAATAVLAVSPRVFAAIVTPGWLIILLLWTPMLTLIAIAAMTAISSRVNDPRTAQQFAAWAVVPFMALFFGQLTGLVVVGPILTLGVFVALIPITILAIWIATRLFQREVILTRWK
jgi:ABC-2 type transport system permease protein